MKYRLDDQDKLELRGETVLRTVYLEDNPDYGIKSGDRGGYVASYECLSQEGQCAVLDRAIVFSGGEVKDGALVHGDVHVFNGAVIGGEASVGGRTDVCSGTVISGRTYIHNTVCAIADGPNGPWYALVDSSMDPGVVPHLVFENQEIVDCEITGDKWLKRGSYLPIFKKEPTSASTPEAHLRAREVAKRSDDDTYVSDRIAGII